MYLKSLELKGFKSFADRSVLSLEPGLTAVVGPNGSGKSNISDAVLWVLGERNAKNIRGQVMEDVIFSGSSARNSVGVAEVSLVLDNTDGSLPVDYTDVVITRRMFRNGESDYLINGTLARRIDVLDILHDSGLGTGTHSIISQGNLDSILQSKPEDRRALIEEAAGVLKHKQRKERSKRQLEAMDQHLLRVNDVVSEISRQLGPLERKAKRALSYKELSSELAEVNLIIAVDDVRLLQKEWEEILEREKKLTDDLSTKQEAVSVAEAEFERLQALMTKEAQGAVDIAQKHRRLSGAAERLSFTVSLLEEKQSAALKRSAELKTLVSSNESKKIELSRELDELKLQLEELSSKKAEAEQALSLALNRLEEAKSERVAAEDMLNETLAKRDQAESALTQARKDLLGFNEKIASSKNKFEIISQRLEDVSLRLSDSLARKSSLEQTYQSTSDEAEQIHANLEALQAESDDINASYDQVESDLKEKRELQARVKAELIGLEEIQRAFDSATGSARAHVLDISESEKKTAWSLSDRIVVDEPFIELVEYLLGDDVRSLLIEDGSFAASLPNKLSSVSATGDISVFGSFGPSKSKTTEKLPKQIASKMLLSHIKCQDAIATKAIDLLLGDVCVCDSSEEAFELARSCSENIRFVTKEGLIVWPFGKVHFHGSVGEKSDGALVRALQIEAKSKELSEIESAIVDLEKLFESATNAKKDVAERLLSLQKRCAEIDGKLSATKIEVQNVDNTVRSLREEDQKLVIEKDAVSAILADADPELQRLAEQISTFEDAVELQKSQLTEKTEAAHQARSHESTVQSELSDAQIAHASLQERSKFLSQSIDLKTAELLSLDKDISDALHAQTQRQLFATQVDPFIATLNTLAFHAKKSVEALERAAASAQSSSDNVNDKSYQARVTARSAHDDFNSTSQLLSDIRIEKGRLEIQVDNALRAITDDCHVSVETAMKLPVLENREEEVERQSRIKRRIVNMGTINPDAADEYLEVKKRYDYLASQLDDLRSARNALSKINRVIDARMKEDFANTFKVVNDNFTSIVELLFPGGFGELRLVDPEDIEHSGVEVVVQPKGKKIAKMSLMSGGEKSLVALALLFAVYKTRTTPFYILDEVEAALDDTNLRRMLHYINELRETTQLIMMTHQRRTMESADVLFGVTMQADGVSKVISQKLDRALQYAEG